MRIWGSPGARRCENSRVITHASHPCTHTGSWISIPFVRLMSLLCLPFFKIKSIQRVGACVAVQSFMDEMHFVSSNGNETLYASHMGFLKQFQWIQDTSVKLYIHSGLIPHHKTPVYAWRQCTVSGFTLLLLKTPNFMRLKSCKFVFGLKTIGTTTTVIHKHLEGHCRKKTIIINKMSAAVAAWHGVHCCDGISFKCCTVTLPKRPSDKDHMAKSPCKWSQLLK